MVIGGRVRQERLASGLSNSVYDLAYEERRNIIRIAQLAYVELDSNEVSGSDTVKSASIFIEFRCLIQKIVPCIPGLEIDGHGHYIGGLW
jgi:hypothetical protein